MTRENIQEVLRHTFFIVFLSQYTSTVLCAHRSISIEASHSRYSSPFHSHRLFLAGHSGGCEQFVCVESQQTRLYGYSGSRVFFIEAFGSVEYSLTIPSMEPKSVPHCRPEEAAEANPQLFSVQATVEEQRLITALRDAKLELRLRVNSLLGLSHSSELEEGEAIDSEDLSTAKRPCPFEEGEQPTKEARTSNGASLDFGQITNPGAPFKCFIRVDNGPPIGSLTESLDGLAPTLLIDAGLHRSTGSHRSPSFEMVFRSPGSSGRIVSRQRWSLDDYVSGYWVIKSLDIVRVKDVQPTHARQTSAVLAACPPDSQHRLFCINLSVAVHREGFVNRKLLESANPGEEEKALFNSLFGYKKGYTVRLWIVLSDKGYQAEEACLEAMRDLFEQRIPPLALVQDKNGEFFLPPGKDSRSGVE